MKTRYIISGAICLMLSVVLSSCGDFLEENPKSVNSSGNYFTDYASLNSGLVGLYSGLTDHFPVSTGTPLFYFFTGTDEMCYRTSNTNIRSVVDRYTYTSTESSIELLWAYYYRIIGRANTIIDAAGELGSISDNDRNRVLGEAQFVRSWCYFQLVQFFGDLPLIDKAIKSSFDYSVGRSPLKDIYELIVGDLEFASRTGVLPTAITDGHATHWAAKTLLGKVYLTMASAKEAARVSGYSRIELSVATLYQKAYDILEDVKDNSGRDLEPVYGDVFRIGKKNTNSESIWEIQFSEVSPYGSQWSKQMGIANKGYSSTAGGWRYDIWAGQRDLTVVPSFRDYYADWDQDTRKSWNVMDSIITHYSQTYATIRLRGYPEKCEHITEAGASTTGLNPGATRAEMCDNTNSLLATNSCASKYRWGDKWEDYPSPYDYVNCPNNIIALRYADVLLMFAEADMKLSADGKVTTSGLNAVNRIIQRARGLDSGGNQIPAAATPDFPDYTRETLTFIELMKERARELCFETWRRHDLARTGMFEYFLAARNAANNLKTDFDPEIHYLLPIPQYEIDNSENKEGMYQNPNY